MNYYNEIDKGAAQWLRNLISAGLIPPGDVDQRSITEVQPYDLRGYTQCHFFAGIGGWSLALQLACWPAIRPVWTGSCPCQPFSIAGKGLGEADERHLWPEFLRLIAECCPATVFGEQVASKDGRVWLAGVRADLEGLGYAAGAADLCAAGIGAPHIRQRLYWMADGDGIAGQQGGALDSGRDQRSDAQPWPGFGGSGDDSGLPDAAVPEFQGQPPAGHECQHGENDNFFLGWGDYWIGCADGKARRIESGLSPLAHGIPARVVRLRGYGNAIVPQVAAEFIAAAMEIAA